MALTFMAQIEAFGEKAIAKAEAIFKQSAQEVFAIAQRPVAQGGNMPVDTNTLRKSLTTGLNGELGAAGEDSYVLAIARADLGDTIFGGWRVKYARPVEYGTRAQPATATTRGRKAVAGRFFALRASQQWQAIVAANAAKVAAQ